MQENIFDIEVEVGKVYTFTHDTMGVVTFKVTHNDHDTIRGYSCADKKKKFYGVLKNRLIDIKAGADKNET